MSREDQRPAPTFLCSNLGPFNLNKPSFRQPLGPSIYRKGRHVDIEGWAPVMACWIFFVVVDTNYDAATREEPRVMDGPQE